ncbi:accessory gland protein Acp29AB [Drosophila ficusphila]|uniref:accessory gland protein Acp29AB n=1 Tax=Drosophila ficusphila TaxID=30025 RepID=UPI001C899886|nr:accessory gland protein Acp29AB [Drosophila ficusphila]
MRKFAIALLCAILSLNFYGALAENESVCHLQDPLNQCGGFCLSVLTPVLNHMTIPQDQKNYSDANKANEVLVRQYTMEKQVAALEEKQSHFEINQRNLTERQVDLEGKLTALQEALSRLEVKVKYLGFQPIGSRYFYIENYSEKSWSAASKTCRQMGGHLADIWDEAELTAVQGNLEKDTHYWLGITDLSQNMAFTSMASGKEAPFFKWAANRPTKLDNYNCVFLYNGEMYDYPCSYSFKFICQTEEGDN